MGTAGARSRPRSQRWQLQQGEGLSPPQWLSPVPLPHSAASTHPPVGGRGVLHVVALLGAGARVGVGFYHLLLDASFL